MARIEWKVLVRFLKKRHPGPPRRRRSRLAHPASADTMQSGTTFAPVFDPRIKRRESDKTLAIISALHMLTHPEGGYFVETDRDALRIPNPFPESPAQRREDPTRNAMTTIHYLLTPATSFGAFHRNKGRTVHTLHSGRGRYVILHVDEKSEGGVRIETFVVGKNLQKGERVQWIVEGGKYKASFLLEDEGGGSDGLLISETVVPGFEFKDHDFLNMEQFKQVVEEPEMQRELQWLVRREK